MSPISFGYGSALTISLNSRKTATRYFFKSTFTLSWRLYNIYYRILQREFWENCKLVRPSIKKPILPFLPPERGRLERRDWLSWKIFIVLDTRVHNGFFLCSSIYQLVRRATIDWNPFWRSICIMIYVPCIFMRCSCYIHIVKVKILVLYDYNPF